jgi:uncharacterized protein HemX
MGDNNKISILENEIRLLKEKLKLYEEGNSELSSTVRILNEINKIRDKALKTEETSHDLVKKMQESLRNYNNELKTSESIGEQLKKGRELINKALEKQKDLTNTVMGRRARWLLDNVDNYF